MQFHLEQFKDVFPIQNEAGEPYILIGGQAVNYWATRYLKEETGLREWHPFTSRDIDFFGTRSDVERIAGQLKADCAYPHRTMMTVLSGIIVLRVGPDTVHLEVVRNIPGLTAAEVRKFAVQSEYEGRKLRVLDPISLLSCKAALVRKVSQSGRRDLEHLKILMYCVRAFLRESLHAVETGHLDIRGWLGAAERVLRLTESTAGRKLGRDFTLKWQECLPLQELSLAKDRRLKSFREKRLALWMRNTS